MRYFLGADLGGTKTHIVIADEAGRVIGFGKSGPGNPQTIGLDGMYKTLMEALTAALSSARLKEKDIVGAGFGIGGYDWPSEKAAMAGVIDKLNLNGPFEIMNDSLLGLVAGAQERWGVAVVSGTGCNCRGWDKDHKREGRVTGYGTTMGEAAGSFELVFRAMQLVSFEWTRRGPKTALSDMFINYVHAKSLEDLLEGYTGNRYVINAEAAPRVFAVARQGDTVAVELVHWAGRELAEMANGVIRQLGFEKLKFDVVLCGSMFEGGPMLIEPMRETIESLAPGAQLVRLNTSPVVGAALIGMEMGGMKNGPEVRNLLSESLKTLLETTQAH